MRFLSDSTRKFVPSHSLLTIINLVPANHLPLLSSITMQNSSSEMLHPTDDASEYNNENEVADILDSMPHSDSNTLIARLRAENQALRAQICHLSDEVKSLQVLQRPL